VVLLDLGLPRMSGYEVAQHLRNQPWGADLLLVAVTGWGLQTHRQQSQEAGFDHHLIKPVDWAALEKLLTQCSNQSAAQHDPGAPNRTRPPAASLG
jgi:CheY-like chemotaxis protein